MMGLSATSRRLRRLLRRPFATEAGVAPTVPAARATPYVGKNLHKAMKRAAHPGNKPDIVFDIFWKHCSHFVPTLMDVDAFITALAKCRLSGTVADAERLLDFLPHIEKGLCSGHMDPDCGRYYATVAWSLTKLAKAQPPLPGTVLAQFPAIFAKVDDVARPALQMGVFLPQHISKLAWSFAKCSCGSQALFREICTAARAQVQQFVPREFSNLLWALAVVRVKDDDVLWHAPREIVTRWGPALEGFTEQDVSNIAWSYATLQVPQRELFQRISSAVETRTSEFTTVALVTTTWAFATLREDAPFARAATKNLEQRLEQVDVRGCAMLLWALATLKYEEWMELFFVSIADRRVKPEVDMFHAQDVSNCLWAFATLRVMHTDAFELLATRAVKILDTANAQAITNVTWSCAKMQFKTPGLYESVVNEALRRSLRTWPPQSISLFSWALAEVGYTDVRLSEAIAGELQARREAFNDVDLATLAHFFRAEERAVFRGAHSPAVIALTCIAAEVRRRALPRTKEALEM
mmetsp:Transcript_38136/g.105040  ORF Transcript_38136/g.105040 Transcript_38136/m.105040 type:complete len:524 (+) Transcript_38136:66-1637(+)